MSLVSFVPYANFSSMQCARLKPDSLISSSLMDASGLNSRARPGVQVSFRCLVVTGNR